MTRSVFRFLSRQSDTVELASDRHLMRLPVSRIIGNGISFVPRAGVSSNRGNRPGGTTN